MTNEYLKHINNFVCYSACRNLTSYLSLIWLALPNFFPFYDYFHLGLIHKGAGDLWGAGNGIELGADEVKAL